ncbi:hypothetical protein L4D06_13670 [Enterovibrio makurazakiensis]|uniref:Uncharacterized protein n=1 Tax=Enterovibrio gelatinilyticus TaxID=2899819 RepID=A0ABT5R1R7_9GAMM|nr:hypothetical protein [Enterovibrio sp. ZSDZ42]MDD1793691.1 hypothetical protein [Enterovibrio sp. ZSDZ42]
MLELKNAVLNYFEELNYRVVSEVGGVYHVKQNRIGLEVELDFSVLGKGILPRNTVLSHHKKLIFMGINDVETVGFESLERFASTLDQHCSLTVLEDEFFDQTMKEIWMFLSQDPRERDVFNDSRFYKP